MNIIAAVDKRWGIGKNGGLLVTIPEDQQLFRQETEGKVVIMGRKTFNSLPGERPLIKRRNIILTHDESFSRKGFDVCHSVEEVLELVKDYDTKDVYVIGGESIYEQFLPYCDTAHITKVDYVYDADRYMVNLDKDSDWKVAQESDEKTYFDIIYEFVEYVRK